MKVKFYGVVLKYMQNLFHLASYIWHCFFFLENYVSPWVYLFDSCVSFAGHWVCLVGS